MPITRKKAMKRIAYWKRYSHTQMADLFYAYDDKNEKKIERVTSYRLSQAGVDSLRKETAKVDNSTLRFIMACKKPNMGGFIDVKPGFSPILAIDSFDDKTKYFDLKWEADPHFLRDTELPGPGSGIDAIPPAGAFLFVFNWLAQKYYELPVTFEDTFRSVANRVESYIYIPAETKIIADKIKRAAKPAVYIHLGVGLSVPSHPFSFRPVIEIREEKEAVRSTANTSAIDHATFFDFSRPCPPYCKPKD